MHCISVYLMRKEEIREDKINHLLEGKKVLKYTELSEGIIAFTQMPKDFTKDKTIAKIMTDYFGGPGEQSATLSINGKSVYNRSDATDWSCKPINDVLKMMGVKCKQGMDEFDTIGLGSYRTNEDFK